MLHLSPIFRTLMRRKFGVFLMLIQISITTAIFSNLAFIIQQIDVMNLRPTGFNENQLFSVTLHPLAGSNYANTQHDIRSIQALAGAEQVASVRWIPLSGKATGGAFRIFPEKEASTFAVQKADVSPEALRTLGLKIVSGRDFIPEDMSIELTSKGDGPKNIIISQYLADTLFGKNQNAIGKIIYEGEVSREIVGVFEDSLGFTQPYPDASEKTALYPRIDENETQFRYLVRAKTTEGRAALIESVSQLLLNNYQNQVFLYIDKIDDVKKQRDHINEVVGNSMVVIIVALGLVVAFAISGQTLFSISQRIKQIGIRRALGASRVDIIVQLITENTMVCIFGLLIGIVLSLAMNLAVVQTLRGIPAMSPLFIIFIGLVLLAICIISAAIPAWQAGKISPSLATRTV